MQPLITIGIPCFNAAQWVARAVESALAQTWPRKEIIVVDDGSTDSSPAVLKQFGDSIRVVSGPNRGVNSARNTILELARGEWVQYLDADDYLRPEKIAAQLREAAPIENADVIYSPVLIERWQDGAPVSIEEEKIDPALDVYSRFFAWQLPQTSGALWRKSILEKIGGWDDKTRAVMCDEHDCYVRALQQNARFVFAPSANAVYRIWSENTRCRSDARPIIANRTALCESLRAWLRERGLWTEAHRRALGRALLEMARVLAAQDIAEAAKYHAQRRRDIHLDGPAAPGRYKLLYRTLGFRGAELLARALR